MGVARFPQGTLAFGQGTKSPRYWPWKQQSWEAHSKTNFPTDNSQQMPGAAPKPVQVLIAAVRDQDEGRHMINELQRAESWLARALAVCQHSKDQLEEMKAAWQRGQKKYTKDLERQDKAIADATNQQNVARALVGQAIDGQHALADETMPEALWMASTVLV